MLSAGTDGIDGNTSAAGAVLDEGTFSDDDELLLRAQTSLRRFDSGTFLDDAGMTIVTGATGNNLRDLRICLQLSPGEASDREAQLNEEVPAFLR